MTDDSDFAPRPTLVYLPPSQRAPQDEQELVQRANLTAVLRLATTFPCGLAARILTHSDEQTSSSLALRMRERLQQLQADLRDPDISNLEIGLSRDNPLEELWIIPRNVLENLQQPQPLEW